MLFPYKYVNHDMEKMHKYMDYIFYSVWLKAHKLGNFDEDLFNDNQKLKNIIKAFYFLTDDKSGGKYFLDRVRNIFNIFKTFNRYELKKIKRWYQANNNIEKLCNGHLKPVLYKDLKLFNATLSNELSKLYSKLYDKKIIGLKDIKDNIGSSIESHYKDFMTTNHKEICPFCGLHTMKGIHHTKREAYDHYLPKGKYPFNSINFKNLAPMCHECNSSYKLENNPIFDKKGSRRKAFYPYMNMNSDIKIEVVLSARNSSQITKPNITINLLSENIDEVVTWDKLFGIKERYKAVCLGTSDGKEWLTQILDDWKQIGKTTTEYMDLLKIQSIREPFNEKRFIKKPFLEACQSAGIIS